MKKFKRIFAIISSICIVGGGALVGSGCAGDKEAITLRVCNWEEYIDLGGWDDDEVIDLASGDILGVNSMVGDFEEDFNKTHDYKVKVEYSTFGTNEDLYNRLSLGDVYDLVCPSDYMLMKLISENRTEDFSESFKDKSIETNYYALNVSPYIDGDDASIFNSYGWNGRAACYMWGTTGIVYNPEKIIGVEDVATWNILLNENYKKQVTVKDNVRDAYFATLGIINSEKLKNGNFDLSTLSEILNDTKTETIEKAQDILKKIKDNVYSFETDAGKADMVTGKVVANYQWSGDAITIMEQAENDVKNNTELWYSVPDECANLWFDGWVMLKDGIGGNPQKKEAAEAFINFLSRPDNAVRNMYYIGYTSSIAGETVFDYLNWNYGADEDTTEETFLYDVSYFFGGGKKITAERKDFMFDENGKINRGRQLFAQYPPDNVKARSVVMLDFGDKLGEINNMWINARCLDVSDISPAAIGVFCGLAAVLITGIVLYTFRYKLFFNKRKTKDGFENTDI